MVVVVCLMIGLTLALMDYCCHVICHRSRSILGEPFFGRGHFSRWWKWLSFHWFCIDSAYKRCIPLKRSVFWTKNSSKHINIHRVIVVDFKFSSKSLYSPFTKETRVNLIPMQNRCFNPYVSKLWKWVCPKKTKHWAFQCENLAK